MAPLVGIRGEETGVPMAVAMVISVVLSVGAFAAFTRGHGGEVLDGPADGPADAPDGGEREALATVVPE